MNADLNSDETSHQLSVTKDGTAVFGITVSWMDVSLNSDEP